jgi:ribulose-5-phosphate 4-epimerase/fuculose-1-phosphate aldolase
MSGDTSVSVSASDSAEARMRDAVVRACRHLAAAGLSPGSSGNISVRFGSGILATPTGSALRSVEAHELAFVTARDDATPGFTPAPGSGRPTKELPLHRAMYDERPDAGAVIHLHSPQATAIACLPADTDGLAALPLLTPYRVMRLGRVPLAPYARPGSEELAESVRALAVRHPVILLAHHGQVVAAPTLDAAIDLAEELETAARLTLLLSGSPARELDADAVAALTPPGA